MTELPSTTGETQKTVNPKPPKTTRRTKKKAVKKAPEVAPEKTEEQNKIQAEEEKRRAELMSTVEDWTDPDIQEVSSTISLNIAASVTSEGYQKKIPRHFQVRSLTKKQKFGLRVLQTGLILGEAELANGQRVNNGPNAIKMILEMIADNAREAFSD